MNTDSLQTYLGLAKAALIAGIDFTYAALSSPDGFHANGVFFMGLGWALIEGVKGYYAAGTKPSA